MRIPLFIMMFLVPALMMTAAEKTIVLNVAGNCGSCKKRIEKAAESVTGVEEATWNKRTKVLTVEFDDTKASVQSITKAILKVGHDVDNKKAEDDAYGTLPECCAYRDREH